MYFLNAVSITNNSSTDSRAFCTNIHSVVSSYEHTETTCLASQGQNTKEWNCPEYSSVVLTLHSCCLFFPSVSHQYEGDRMNDCEKLSAIYRSCKYQQSCIPVVYFTYRIVTQYNTRDSCTDIRTKKTRTPCFSSKRSSL